MKKFTLSINFKPILRVFALLCLLILGINETGWAQTIISAQSGEWNNTTTWVGGIIPGAAGTDDVIIQTGHNVTLAATTSATAKTLTIAGGTLTLDDSTPSNSILNIKGNFVNNGTFTANAGTRVVFNGIINQDVSGSSSTTFNRVQINNTGTAPNNVVGLANSNTTIVTGDFDVFNGVFNTLSNIFMVNGATNINGGTFTDTANGGTNTFKGNFTVNPGGNFTQPITPSNNSIYVFNDNITNNGTFDLNISVIGTNITLNKSSPPLVITANATMNFGLDVIASSDVTLAGATGNITFKNLTIAASKTVINNNTSTFGVLVGFGGTGVLGGTGTFINNRLLTINNAATPMALGTLTANTAGNLVRYDGNGVGIKNTTYHHLDINFGTKTLQGPTTVNGNFNVLSGSPVTLALANFDLNIKGNWTGGNIVSNIMNVTSTTGTVRFNSNLATQTISGFTSFNNLEINNTFVSGPTVTLFGTSSSTIVSGILTFTSGRLVLGANDITLTKTMVTASDDQFSPQFSPNLSSYIETNGSGKVIRNNLLVGSDYYFPVGDASAIRWVMIRLDGIPLAIGNASCRFTSGPISPPLPGGATNPAAGSWNISGTSNVSLGFYTPGGTVTSSSKVHIFTTSWNLIPTTFSSPNYFSIFTSTPPITGVNFTVFTPLAGNDYFSTGLGTGDWNDNNPTTGTWSNNASGTPACGCTPADSPVGTANVTIRSGNTVNLNVPANIATLTIGGTLNASNNLTVNGATNISSSGIFDDKSLPSPTPIYTFDILNITGGIFQKTVANNSTYNFTGNIVNSGGTFNLAAGGGNNSFWNLGDTVAGISVINDSNNDMRFNTPVSGLGVIVGDVTINNTAFNGSVYLYGNGVPSSSGNITINSGKTLLNLLGVNTAPTGRRLIASPRNGTGGFFTNSGVVEISGAANIGLEPTYNLGMSNSLVIFNGVSDVMAVSYRDIIFAGANTLAGNITVNGNLTINPGATLNSNSQNIDIKGNWSRNGTGVFSAGATTATVTFSGTNAQTITGTTTFHNITLINTDIITGVTVASGTNFMVTGNWNNTGFFNPGVGTSNVIAFGGSPGQTISGGASGTSFNNLQINPGSQVTLNSSIFIEKDLSNNGIFNGGTGGIQVGFIGGNINQNIQGTGTTTFNNLFIGKTGANQTVTLSQSVTVTNTLAFSLILSQGGKIVLGTNNLTYQGTGAIMGANATNYIVTNSGKLIVSNTNATNFIFPVGDLATYQPVEFQNAANASVSFGTPTVLVPNSGVGAWRISNSGFSTTLNFNNPQGGTLGVLSKIATYTTTWTPNLTSTVPFLGIYQLASISIPAIAIEFGIFTPASNTFYSIVNGGSYTSAASWSSTSGGLAGTVSPTFATNPIIFIENGNTINVTDAGHIAPGTTVNIATGSTLSFADGTSGFGANNIIANLNFAPSAKVRVNNNILPEFSNSNFVSTTNTIIEFAGTTSGSIPSTFALAPYRNLIISGTGTKTLSNNTTIIRDLTIEGNLNSGGFDITLEGNLNAGTAGATFGPTTVGTVALTGTALQTLTANSGGLTFNNLTINQVVANTFGVALAGGDITFNPSGALTLTRGKIALGNNNLKMENVGTTISGVNVNSYIVTNGSGRLSRIIGATLTDFPVGDNANLRLVKMSSATGGVATAGFVAGAPTNPTANAINVFAGTWKLSSTNAATIAFTNAATLPTVKIQRFTSTSTWAEETTSFTPGTPPIYTSTSSIPMINETTFALFEIGIPLAVPKTDIRFLPITINNETNKVTFSWIGVPNATGYEVRIGKVNVVSNILVWRMLPAVASTVLSYVNNNIEYDVTTYYSVRAIGTPPAIASEWSSFVNVFVSSINNPTTSLGNSLENMIKVSPNPSSGDFIVDFGGINTAKTVVRVHNAQGKQVFISENNSNLMTISLENFASGIYLLEMQTEKGRVLKRLVRE